MRKEVIFAIILGLILGGVIIYGINLANNSVNHTDDQDKNLISSPTVTPTPSPTLKIISPQNHQVLFEDTIILTGKTEPLAHVSLIWEEDEIIIQADDQGSFSQEIELVGGDNQINISAANDQDYQEEIVFNLIYTTANID